MLGVRSSAGDRQGAREPPHRCRAARTTSSVVLIGTAKPIPSLPPLWLSICELIPTTWPTSISGPPELPETARIGLDTIMIEKLSWRRDLSRECRDYAAVTGARRMGSRSRRPGRRLSPWWSRPAAQRIDALRVSVDLEQGDVGRWVGPHDLGLLGGAVTELDADPLRALDHVGVGGDVTVVVDLEAFEPVAVLCCLLREAEDRLCLLIDRAGMNATPCASRW